MASTDEVEASMLTAEEHLRDARDAYHEGRYHDCAYHSASAAENAGNALIIALGGRVPRTHRNAEAMEFAATRLQPSWLRSEGFRKMLESLSPRKAGRGKRKRKVAGPLKSILIYNKINIMSG